MRFKRTLSGLVAADEAASEALRSLKAGEEIDCEIKKQRIHKNLRRWWGLCNLVYENSEQFGSPDAVHQFLKIKAGYADQIVCKSTGEVYFIARSIAFGRMDEVKFQGLWKRAVKVVCEEIIPGVESNEVELEILKCCGLAA